MMNKIIVKVLVAAACISAAVSSCKNMYDIEPKDAVDAAHVYQTQADADAAVIGIYGKFAKLSKQFIILNELRADLVDVTRNSDVYLREINNHSVTAANPYANPKPFYDLINDCNDALRGFTKMRSSSKLSVQEFQLRYSDIGSLRSWLYLQLGMHYGSVPYITEPFDSPEQLQKLASYPKVPFAALLDSLIGFTSKLEYNRAQIFTYPTGNTLNVTIDANATNKIFITRSILLGELYLWKNDYLNASTNFKAAMDAQPSGTDFQFMFRIAYDDSPRTVNSVAYADNVGDRRQDPQYLYTGIDRGWRSLFAVSNTNRGWNNEWYWSVPFLGQLKTKNPLPALFSKTYGSYVLQPSQSALSYWNSQTETYGIPFDPRRNLSTELQGGDLVITKHTDNPLSSTGGGQWNIWRAAGVHLHFAESANRDGKGIISWGLLNNGMSNALVPVKANPPTYAELQAMQTPFPEPYYFDARDAGATDNSVRQAWSKNIGIRGRALVTPLSTSLQTNMIGLEDALINEGALELAFEGERWGDLLRISLRRDDPSFLANKVYDKLQKAGNPEAGNVRAKLLAKDYYIPFDIFK